MAEKLITSSPKYLLLFGGGMAWFDLTLLLIERVLRSLM